MNGRELRPHSRGTDHKKEAAPGKRARPDGEEAFEWQKHMWNGITAKWQ